MSQKPAEYRFSLRPATADDLEAILAIEAVSYPIPWSTTHFLAEIHSSKSDFLVYTDDETDTMVAGYIVFWNLGTETHILNVAISPDWRGLGIASFLVRAAINQSYRQKHERVFLEVRVGNVAAVKLYEKIGFHIDHTKKNFYDDGEDAHFMVLNINQEDH